MGRHALDGPGLEQVGVVGEVAGVALGRAPQAELQLEADRAVLDGQHAHGQPWQAQLGHGRVLEDEGRLHQRGTAQVPLHPERLHQPLEGHGLVGEGAEHTLPFLGEQRADGVRAGHPGPQRQRVDEEADQPLQLSAVPAGQHGADEQVLLSGVAAQQEVERPQQEHEGRDALAVAEGLQRLGQGEGQEDGARGAASGLQGGARLVRGQLQCQRCPGEPLAPPAELARQHVILQPAALPRREVRVLHRQLRQRRGPALGEGHVERGQLPHHDPHRPAIRHDVVLGEHQDVLPRPQLEQGRAKERAAHQVEGAERLVTHPAAEVSLRLGLLGQVRHRQRHGRGRADDLHGAARALAEGGAQRFVPAHQLRQAPLQGAHLQRTRQAECDWEVVEGAARFELVQEPQALLRQGHGQLARARHRHQRRQLGALARQDGPVHPRRQVGQRGCVEEVPQRQLHAEGGAHAADGLRGQQGVSTQLEEVVREAHLRHTQHRAPHPREQRLRLGARREEVRTPAGGGQVRGGQGLAVHLAVGCQRHGGQHHHGGGHHVLGQRLLERRTQRGAVGPHALTHHHITHEALAAGSVLAHRHHRLAHGGQLRQGGLHLARLDAEAAHLHLRIGAADEVQRAVLAPAHHVAGAVEAGSVLAREGVRDEALGREGEAARVAARHADAADEELALHPHGHRRAARIQHVHPHVGQRAADGRHASVRHAPGERGDDRGFRGAVGVEQPPS